jgi:hypothetical protein
MEVSILYEVRILAKGHPMTYTITQVEVSILYEVRILASWR